MAQPMTDHRPTRPLPRARRRAQRWPLWAKVAMAGVVVAVVMLAVLAASRLLDRRDFSSTTLGGPIQRIDLQIAAGDIKLVAGSSDDVTVQRTSNWRLRRPTTTATVDGSTARIHATCPRVVVPLAACSVDHRVEVPPGVRVDVRTDSGTVTATGLDGWVRIVTSNGRVEASELHTDELIVDTVGGSVSASFGLAPSRVDVRSGGGDIELVLPADMYDIMVAADGGEVDLQVESEDLAERLVQLRSDGGDVIVLPHLARPG
jgi:hypothetical protein